MSKKHRYSSQDIRKFETAGIVGLLVAGCIVAIDVAKTGFYAGIADLAGEVVRIVRFEHPRQTRAFLEILEALRAAGCPPQIVMKPTGSYGDAVRHQCHKLGFQVFMSSPKHTHDIAEVIDGVPSMHDAKAVVALAKLHAIRPARKWEPESAERRDLRSLVDRREMYADMKERLYGRLEGQMARTWPEFGEQCDVRTRRSWMPLLCELPGPEMVSAQPEKARDLLLTASRGMLESEQIAALIACAKGSLGVPMTEGEREQLRELVREIRRLTTEVDRMDKEIKAGLAGHPGAKNIARSIGPSATAAMLAYLGNPSQYGSAAALEKAAGLNVKVRSSGKFSGQLKITKRGPGIVRRALHLASLRLIQSDAIVRAWYSERGSFKQGNKLKAVTAVTRKLIRAVWHLAKDNGLFDSSKLFDTRRLRHPSESAKAVFGRPFKRRSSSVDREPPRSVLDKACE